MLRISPFWRSSPEDEMTSSLLGGEPERALLISVPSPGGDIPLFDIAERKQYGAMMELRCNETTPSAGVTHSLELQIFVVLKPLSPRWKSGGITHLHLCNLLPIRPVLGLSLGYNGRT